MTFGIIGYGAFGKLLTEVLAPYGEVKVYSKRNISDELIAGAKQADIEEVSKSKIIIISTGLNELEEACKKISSYVGKDTLVADVCSVKAEPVKIMKKVLGGKCQLIATHPLFGPQTVKEGQVSGERIVVCPVDVAEINAIESILKDALGLEVIEMDPKKHDEEMAWVHGLTFFVGRALLEMEPPKSDLSTTYYQKLLDLVELESSHSIELFKTVEQGNDNAAAVRKKFIKVLESLDKKLEV